MSARDAVAGDPLLVAAFDTFARHGFRRTTMRDLADAAGLSRPALYLRVANKDELLCMVASRLLQDELAQARDIADGPGTVAERVEGVLAAKLNGALDLAAASPHVDEVLEHYYRLAPTEYHAYNDEMHLLLVAVLGAACPDPDRCATLAAALQNTVRGLENDLSRPDQARRQLHELVRTAAAGLTADAPPP